MRVQGLEGTRVHRAVGASGARESVRRFGNPAIHRDLRGVIHGGRQGRIPGRWGPRLAPVLRLTGVVLCCRGPGDRPLSPPVPRQDR